MNRTFFAVSSLIFALVPLCSRASLTAFGISSDGTLFRFDPDAPASATSVGNVGVTIDAIDFRPLAAGETSPVLYGVGVNGDVTQLYTIDTQTAVATPVGAGFATVSPNGAYDLSNSQIGFDFNPTTLQADSSMRIRLVASNSGANLRLNSATGQIAATDVALAFVGVGGQPRVDAVAYINNIATQGGTTSLFDLDVLTDSLYQQNPPNNGSLNAVGPYGVTVDSLLGGSFDIYTDPLSVDPTIGGDRGLAVFTRIENPTSYLLYEVNLATGQVTNGRSVDGGRNFSRGFAIMPTAVPEPAAALFAAMAGVVALRRRRPA